MTTALADRSAVDISAQLRRGLAALKLELSAGQLEKLLDFLALLAKWNRVYNLTAVRDQESSVSVHLLDSLAIASHLRGQRILDVGSGAGFPGIPLALAKPESELVLLDSSHKKTAFLRQAVAQLQLKNVSVVCERVEAWQPARKFDLIVSRAFARLSDFVRLTQHLLATGGEFAAMKGAYPHDEIKRLPPTFRVKQVVRIAVPGLVAQRHLILVERA